MTVSYKVDTKGLKKDLKAYNKRVVTAMEAIARVHASKAVPAMKRNAKWEDRTGNARGGLSAAVKKESKLIIDLYLIHGAEYGIWLELARQGRLAILAPTLHQMIPDILKSLKRVFK